LRDLGRIIDFGATPGRLRPHDLESLTVALEYHVFSLGATETVAIGDHYRTSADTIATATTEVAAMLNHELHDDLMAGRVIKGLDGATAWESTRMSLSNGSFTGAIAWWKSRLPLPKQ
jgi:hypothetical protein